MSIIAVNHAREAKTTYRTLGSAKHISLLLCDLHTGRTNQLRVHLSSIGHPILGDPTYSSQTNDRLAEENDIHDLCLHAWKLSFDSPSDGKRKVLTAPLPQKLRETLKRIGIAMPT